MYTNMNQIMSKQIVVACWENQRRKKWERKRNNHKKFFKINHCKFYLLIRFFTSNFNFVFHFTHKLWIENMGEDFYGFHVGGSGMTQDLNKIFCCYLWFAIFCRIQFVSSYFPQYIKYFFHFSLQPIIEAKNKKQNGEDMK